MDIETMVIENGKQIVANTTNISMLLRLTYIIISGIGVQIILSVKGLFNGKKNKKAN